MDISPYRLLQLLVPRLPLLAKTVILSKLSMSTNSDRQDTRTEVVVNLVRSIMGGASKSMKVLQDGSVKEQVVKGKKWIAKATVPAPETDVRDLVLQAIKELGDGTERFTLPDVVDVSGEWTGYRDCAKNESRMDISEKEQYDHMMKEVTSDATVLYFHGGAYFLMDPIGYRGTTAGLARKTGGRCFSVRYRLAPQSAFPAQLIDAFIAYLYLLSPPEGAFHSPVAADKIVFAGDSAGGNLSCSLLLLLITLRNRMGVKTVRFHGKDVPIVLPAGIAVNSPWTDVTRSLPTIHSNARFDYLDPPSATGLPNNPLPPDEIWPASPPRAEIFCTASLLSHPLVSPVLATPDMWRGGPPAFMCCGSEGLEDEVTVTARRMYLGDNAVEFVGYEGMPHCFCLLFPTSEAGKDCFDRWTSFIIRATTTTTITTTAGNTGTVQRTTTGSWMKALIKPITFVNIDLAHMGVSDDLVLTNILRSKNMAVDRERDEIKNWEKKETNNHKDRDKDIASARL